MLDEEQALKIAVHVLHAINDLRSTAGEIAALALQPQWRGEWQKLRCEVPEGTESVDLARELGRKLSGHIARTRKDRLVVEGSRRGWSLGPKANQYLTSHPDFAPSESTHFIGASGEHAVIGELLAINWNATKLPVDNGADVVAVQGNEIRTVQVKCAHAVSHKPEAFQIPIGRAAHERFRGVRHYYILVLRRRVGSRYLNDYLILSSSELENYVRQGAFYGGENDAWTVRIEIDKGRYLLKGDEKFDVSDHVNAISRHFV